MRNHIVPRLARWPFFLGDVLLLGLACLILNQSAAAFGRWEILGIVVCVAGGAVLAVLPYLLEYRGQMKLAESAGLTSVVEQMDDLKQLAAQIGYATSQWQVVRESADKTASSAREIAQGIAAERKSFNELAQKANESEKATLKLEVEKLRRAEFEWLQVVVRILDHVYALHQAAIRSSQPAVAEQITRFQAACIDAGRRMGLAPFVAAAEEAFDEQRHQVDGGTKPSAGAAIEVTLAAGYTFQGRLIRPALVQLRSDGQVPARENAGTEPVENAEAETLQ